MNVRRLDSLEVWHSLARASQNRVRPRNEIRILASLPATFRFGANCPRTVTDATKAVWRSLHPTPEERALTPPRDHPVIGLGFYPARSAREIGIVCTMKPATICHRAGSIATFGGRP